MIAFLLGALKVLTTATQHPEFLGGMLGYASIALLLGALFAAGFALPLASRLDAAITMDTSFYEFIRTAFICRAAGCDAALAVRTANGALPANMALGEGELCALPELASEGLA